MNLIKTDLFRNFAIGFVLGGLIVCAQISPELLPEIAPQALVGANK